MEFIWSALGIGCLAIAVFRALGLPLVIVSSVFLFYVFFGHMSFMPDVVQWKGASFGKASWHFWMQTEGVFGVALGVAASMIFLFVLFGALLEKAGAGNYFIKLTGPQKTVSHWANTLRTSFGADVKAEKEAESAF